MDLCFRPFDPAQDRTTVKGWLEESLRIGNENPIDMEDNAANYFAAVERTQQRDERFCSVLVVYGRSTGFLDAFPMQKRPGSGFMRFCYIIPEMRGTGISRRLVEYCDELLSGFGCDEILLDVRSNNTRAVGFYAGRGWVVLEQKEGGLLRMSRKLEQPIHQIQ